MTVANFALKKDLTKNIDLINSPLPLNDVNDGLIIDIPNQDLRDLQLGEKKTTL